MIYVFIEHDDEDDFVHGVCEGPEGVTGEELWAQFKAEVELVKIEGQWYPPGTILPKEPLWIPNGYYKVMSHRYQAWRKEHTAVDLYDAYVDWVAGQPGWKRLDYREMPDND
jgi:hypothetical protein